MSRQRQDPPDVNHILVSLLLGSVSPPYPPLLDKKTLSNCIEVYTGTKHGTKGSKDASQI